MQKYMSKLQIMHKQWRNEITLPTSASIHVNYQNPWALFPADLKGQSQAAGMYPDLSGTCGIHPQLYVPNSVQT